MRLFRRGGVLSVLVGVGLLLAVLAMGITEETPLGSIRGSVRMGESGLPLPGSLIVLSSAVVTDDAPKPRVTFADQAGEFDFLNVPAGEYRIEASAKAHSLPPTLISIREGSATALDLELKPKAPELRVYSSERVFLPDESPEIEVHGFGFTRSLSVKVYRIELDHFLRAGSIYGVLYSLTDNPYSEFKRQSPDTVGKLVATEEHTIQNADAEGSFTDVITVPKLSEGFYWVQCAMGNLVRGAFLSVTKVALVTKSSPGKTLAFVTDLRSGRPISGVPISIDDDKKWRHVGTSDQSGVAALQMPAGNRRVLLLATLGESHAISGFFSRAAPGGSEENDSPRLGLDTTIFAYTDRPIYRPGDRIEFKGFVRKRLGAQYSLPGIGAVTCEVRGSNEDLLDKFSMQVGTQGSFHGHFSTQPEMPPGDYFFNFKGLGGEHAMIVTLAAYRKPEFSVNVTWSKRRYTMGETMQATVRCEYYFGGPVAGAKVSASLFRNQAWGSENEDPDSDYEDDYRYEGGGGDYLERASGVTDANGEAVFTFQPKPDKQGDYGFYTPDYEYSLSAEVAEAGDRYFSGEGSVRVTQGSIRISLQTDRYMVAPGGPIKVDLTGIKIDSGEPAAGQTLHVTYGTESWTARESVFTAFGNQRVTLDQAGTASVSLAAAKEGSFVIRVSGQDERGNIVKRQAYVYVGTDSFEPPPSAGPLSVTLDKALYRPGDTCKALVSLAKPGGAVLVTVEAEQVLWSKVVVIHETSAMVDIPVKDLYLPRVTISAACVQGKKFLEASKSLKLDLTTRKLTIGVTSNKSNYLPGEKAVYRIQATGPDGKPVQADFSLAVVDESVYALKSDSTNPIRAFYPARPNLVETNFSFPELYLDGGDKSGGIPIRKDFRDTAAWVPSVITDIQGNATVEVMLPDNLTTWRATVIGVSEATDVGRATQNLIVSKPLMVRLQGPKFMVAGDRQQIAAVVTNRTGTDATVSVSLQPEGFSTGDRLDRKVRVGQDQTASVEWEISPTRLGRQSLVAKAWIEGGSHDGVMQTIDVKPHARELHYPGAGEVRGVTTIQVLRRNDAETSLGALTISLSPTIGASLYGALDNLIDYPYGCVEQTMSRMLPAMVVGRSLEGIGLIRPDLKKRIPEIAARSFAKLEEMQNADGGWGWWGYDQSDPFMTAYVLDGLREASAAGFDTNPFMLERALEWAAGQINEASAEKWPLRSRLYLAYELAMYGKTDVATKTLKRLNLEGAGPVQVATAALLAEALGPDWSSQKERWLANLKDTVVEGSTTAYWVGNSARKNSWDEEDVYGAELTAVPLMALQKLAPEDPLIAKGVRALLASRMGNWWWSTRDSSFALRAIAAYMRREELPGANASVQVSLNGKPISHVRLETKNLLGARPTIRVPIGQLQSGQNTVELRLAGSKLAYYSFDLEQFAAAPRLGRLVSGDDFTVVRTYHILRSQRMEDGSYRLSPSREPVLRARSGDLIQCRLTLTSSTNRKYIMLTDPFPSNCHVQEDNYQVESYDWYWWYSDRVVYDDRITFFAREVPAGTHSFTYVMRAESPGVAHALPAVAQNMYNPEDRTSDGESELEVRP